jgi:hypothetical protein
MRNHGLSISPLPLTQLTMAHDPATLVRTLDDLPAMAREYLTTLTIQVAYITENMFTVLSSRFLHVQDLTIMVHLQPTYYFSDISIPTEAYTAQVCLCLLPSISTQYLNAMQGLFDCFIGFEIAAQHQTPLYQLPTSLRPTSNQYVRKVFFTEGTPMPFPNTLRWNGFGFKMLQAIMRLGPVPMRATHMLCHCSTVP